MKLEKGDIIKEIKTNNNPHCESANTELTFIVERVNKTSYSLKCIEGYMLHNRCKIAKDFAEKSVDEYGTEKTWVLVQ